jgi:hypothetical protein
VIEREEECAMFDVWIRAVTRPNLATYEALLQEKEDPSLAVGLASMVVAAFLGGALTGLCNGGGFLGYPGTFALAALVAGIVITIAGFLVLFLINMGVLLAASRALGGQGTLGSQSYLLAASAAPMGVLLSVCSAAPFLGHPLFWAGPFEGLYLALFFVCALERSWPILVVVVVLLLAGALYASCLQVLGLRAAHRFGWGRAAGAMLVASLCSLLMVACLLETFRLSWW